VTVQKNLRRIKTRWMFFGVLSVVCAIVPHAVAEQPRVLGLEQLIQMALERSPELRVADQDIAAALSDLQQAKAAQWAQLDVTGVGGIINDAKEPLVVVSPTPGPDGMLRGHLEKDDTHGLGPFGKLEFTISQPLYTFGKIMHRKYAASEAVAVQQAAKEKTQRVATGAPPLPGRAGPPAGFRPPMRAG
jgi:outer membrane protein TolC